MSKKAKVTRYSFELQQFIYRKNQLLKRLYEVTLLIKELSDEIKITNKKIQTRTNFLMVVLSEREQQILDMYYSQGLDFEDIGHKLDVTKQRVVQLLDKSLEKLYKLSN